MGTPNCRCHRGFYCGCQDYPKNWNEMDSKKKWNEAVLPRKEERSMEDRKVHSIWYRSLLEDGSLWCESPDLEEVRRMTAGKKATIKEQVTYLVYGNWNTIEET